jgi:hypothetical protein
MKEIKVNQNTNEWMTLRCGKITASNFDLLIPSKKIDGFTVGQRTYLLSVAAEILTGMWEDNFQTKAMQQGHEREPQARDELSKIINAPIRESGFWEYSDYVGISPDGIGGFNEFTVELKCPQPKAHMLHIYDMKEFDKKYQWQYKGQMWGTGIDHCYYGSFNPDFPDNKKLIYSGCDLSDSDKDLFDNRIGHAVEFVKKLITEDTILVDFK